ncbi:type II CAAX endopeptidase family protein [Aerococcus mictus]|uniref:CPBP family intramembrane glutamic endopeptidase n=1 Tax=Aerococcus mictus TaxID=2976810 RepID=UPI002FCFDFDD
MTSGVYQRLERRLAALLTPDDKDEAVLRIELLRAVRRAHISSVFFMPVVAITCAVLDLNWVGISHIYIWLAAATLTPLLPRAVFLRMERAVPPPQDAGLWTLRCALASLPMQVAWPSMVAFAWIEGDPANNALMVSFLCAGLVLGATLSSASLPIALLGVAAYVPFLAIYRVEVDGGLWWTVPAAQIGLCGYSVIFLFLLWRGRRRGLSAGEMGFTAFGWRWLAVILALALTLRFVSGAFHLLLSDADVGRSVEIARAMMPGGLGWNMATAIMIVVVAPVTEELFFRVALYGSLTRYLPRIAAAVLSVVIFAALHTQYSTAGGWLALVLTGDVALLGAGLMWLYLRSGSIWPSVIMHGLSNGMTLAALLVFLSTQPAPI